MLENFKKDRGCGVWFLSDYNTYPSLDFDFDFDQGVATTITILTQIKSGKKVNSEEFDAAGGQAPCSNYFWVEIWIFFSIYNFPIQ